MCECTIKQSTFYISINYIHIYYITKVMFNFTEQPPLSLYIHFPWCVQKCPYCDFNSHELKNTLDEKKYIHALLSDLDPKVKSNIFAALSNVRQGYLLDKSK